MFEAGDHVFLRVTPTIGIGRKLKSRKLIDSLIHWPISDHEMNWTCSIRDCSTTTFGKPT